MKPEDFHDPVKLRAMAMQATTARIGIIGTGRQNLENVVNNCNMLASIYEKHQRSAAEATALKQAGITRQPPKTMAGEIADRAATAKKNKKRKDENELPDVD